MTRSTRKPTPANAAGPTVAERLAEIGRRVDREIAAGRHAPGTPRRVCGRCREWVCGIYHRTLDGLDLCFGCADTIGAIPAEVRARVLAEESAALEAATRGGPQR